jgi:hypothetical protein
MGRKTQPKGLPLLGRIPKRLDPVKLIGAVISLIVNRKKLGEIES